MERYGIFREPRRPRKVRNLVRHQNFYDSDVKYNWENGECVGYSLHPKLYAGKPPRAFQNKNNSSHRISLNSGRRARKVRHERRPPREQTLNFDIDRWADAFLSNFSNERPTPGPRVEILGEDEIAFHQHLRELMNQQDKYLGRMKFAQRYPEFRISDVNPFGGPEHKIAVCVFGHDRPLVFPVPLRLYIDVMAPNKMHLIVPTRNWPRNQRTVTIVCPPITDKGSRGLKKREKRFKNLKFLITGNNQLAFRDFSLMYAVRNILGASCFRIPKDIPTPLAYAQACALWIRLSLPTQQ